MGSLEYGNKTVEFGDRILAHIQIVIVRKLRRGESFLLSWKDSSETGHGRSSIWVHPAIPLYFKFHGGRSPSVNPVWLAELTLSADSSFGMLITSEKTSPKITQQTNSREC
ncbi:ATP-dependent DNA ligase [Cryobacterium levicorallinum]|uniref:ATP-dependent DNA ligase n=1 Tax=Cryobacterium levicorallinum TaxID=995038 RepID=A0A4R8VLD5_9MICO|nr:ATP-dependent DNA ligase [Cryobacterium levicorallinum]GEP28758.1 hypothetical protein CLE01_33560 [Cryobacterium levicorallinum]